VVVVVFLTMGASVVVVFLTMGVLGAMVGVVDFFVIGATLTRGAVAVARAGLRGGGASVAAAWTVGEAATVRGAAGVALATRATAMTLSARRKAAVIKGLRLVRRFFIRT
jgi:hypothetical protein